MMDAEQVLAKIRAIRSLVDPKLKPSPFLRDRFVDEWGVEQPVRLRDYQVVGIMNLLQVPDMILGDDTGLGKTLEILSTLGYIWLKEPEYVPLVVTKKSSLYQWAAEADRFMQGLEVVTVDGMPYERDATYADFFQGYDPDRKRLAIVTYDVLLKDLEENVVRDRAKKPSAEVRKRLKAAKAAAKAAKESLEEMKAPFNLRFADRGGAVLEYVRQRLNPPESGYAGGQPPPKWDGDDEGAVQSAISARKAIQEAADELAAAKDEAEPPVRAQGLFTHVQKMLQARPDLKFMFVMDEIHQLKNYRGKMHMAAKKLSGLANRKIGMTATPVKNRLMEFFALFQIVQPSLFPLVTRFQDEYCITKLQDVGGNRKVRLVVGHSKAHLEKFVKAAEPYYLSRRKHDVAKELPDLITRELPCPLSPEQEELYDMAEMGALETGDDPDAKPAELLKAMTLVQQACNAPQLIMDESGEPFEGASSKLEALIDIVQENPDMKTIIFSRFEKMVTLIERELGRLKVPCVRITGKEAKAQDRNAARERFQSASSGVNVILITIAGAESINLHAAEHTVFVDSPWSWGDYVQLTGRNIRIGSHHKGVLATHLIARRATGAKTIDDYVIKVLRSKKALADVVAGVSLKDGLNFTESEQVMELLAMLKSGATAQDVRAARKPGRLPAAKKKAAKPEAVKPPAPPPVLMNEIDLSDV